MNILDQFIQKKCLEDYSPNNKVNLAKEGREGWAKVVSGGIKENVDFQLTFFGIFIRTYAPI